MSLINESNQQTARDSLGGLTKVVPNFIALRLLTAPELTGSVLAICGYVLQDTLGGTFVWNAGSGLPDDNLTVIRPLSVPQSSLGRWVLGSFQNGGGGGGGSDVYLWAADYGVLSNGVTNDTAALQTALNAAGADPLRKTLVLGCGVTLIDAVAFPGAGVTIPTNVTLLGENRYGTIIKIDPASVPSNNHQQRVVVATSAFSTLENLTLDGNRGAWNKSGWTLGNFLLTRPALDTGLDGIIYRNLTCQHIDSGVGAESGGIDTNGALRCLIDSCDVFDVAGSGISSQGQRYGVVCTSTKITNCRAWDCDWNGITLYSSADVTVDSCEVWDVLLGGINIEWSDGIRVRDCDVQRAGIAGIYHEGMITDVLVECCKVIDCGSASTNGANFGFYFATYAVVNPGTGTNDKGVPQSVKISNCSSTPHTGKPDAFVTGEPTCNVGMSIPQVIILASEGAHNWTINYTPVAMSAPQALNIGGVTFPRAPREEIIQVGDYTTWDVGGVVALSPYAGTGAIGQLPFTMQGSSVFANIGFRIAAFGRILVRCRIKVEDVGEWRIAIATSTGSPFVQAANWRFNAQTEDIGQWVQVEIPCTISALDRTWVCQIQSVSAGVHVADIDNFIVTRLDASGITDRTNVYRENVVMWGTTPPTTGFHTHGDTFINPLCFDGGGVDYWRCVATGTPGTWQVAKLMGYRSVNTSARPTFDALFPGEILWDNFHKGTFFAITVGNGTDDWNYHGYFPNTSTVLTGFPNGSLSSIDAQPASDSAAVFCGTFNVAQTPITTTANLTNFDGGLHATHNWAIHNGPGICTTAVGGFFQVLNQGLGTITRAIGALIQAPLNSGGGVITTAYGLKVEGFGATDFPLHVNGGISLFAGPIQSTVATGTPPFVIASTTATPNLNASLLLGNTWANPSVIGSGTPQNATFVTCTVTTLHVGANQVVEARRTGWTPWTGSSARGTFDTSSATLVNVAQTMKALLDDLTAHGLIGT